MKELTIKEKAKRYDEAKFIMEKYLKSGNAGVIAENTIKKAFPELAESEDEKIRKWLIHYFKEVCDNVSEKEKKGIVAWLEKQCKTSPIISNFSNIGKVEQKPAAWSEEDEEIHRKCICAMRASACGFPEEEKFVEQVDNWLKSLKDRCTWRPTDEQMDALESAVSSLQSTALESLYQNLTKINNTYDT